MSLFNSLKQLSNKAIETHLAIRKYGDFVLTDGITPSLNVKPQTGYKHIDFQDNYRDVDLPVIEISASKEILFELFLELTDLFGTNQVNVVLETSHMSRSLLYTHSHIDLPRDDIDISILQSILWDFKNLLLNDGRMGIALVNYENLMELQFDEHKILVFFNWQIVKNELFAILERYNIQEHPNMQLIVDDEHIHTSSEEFDEEFRKLATRIGVEEDNDNN